MGLFIGYKLQSIRQILSMSQQEFGDSIGISRANLSQIEQGKQNPTLEQLVSIERIYFIPFDYFFKDDEKLIGFVNNQLLKFKKVTENPYFSSVTSEKATITAKDSIPLISVNAMAGAFNGDMQVLEHECERFVIPTFRGADFLISVKGSSMNPKYNSGDIVACKKLPIDTFFQWNKVYVLDTDQGPLIKRIKKGSTTDKLLIVSDNQLYEPFELSRSNIYHIALVLGVIRLE